MQEIKSYTDLSQSRKLAEILPLESADSFYVTDDNIIITEPYITYLNGERNIPAYKGAVPCWSLAALFSILPSGYVIVKNYQGLYYVESRGHERSTNIFNNSIDACYEMALKLHELKIL